MSHAPTVISLTNISMRWESREVLAGVNLDIRRGDRLIIKGPNGGGKTTLLRIMLRLLRPSSGTVGYFGPDGCPADRLRIGYLPQKSHIDSRFPITVEEVIASGLLASKTPAAERRLLTDNQIRLLDLEKHRRNSIGNLSGGQLQRALIARAMVSDPDIIVFDEPLSYLDYTSENRFREILTALTPDKTLICVTHSDDIFASIATRTVEIDRTLISSKSQR